MKTFNKTPGDWGRKGGVTERIRVFMRELGFAENGPHSWSHESQGEVCLRRQVLRPPEADRLCHVLREAWRSSMWQGFLETDRRETRGLNRIPYDRSRLKLAQKLCHRGTSAHIPAILTGAFVSPLRLFRNRGIGAEACPFCEGQPGSAFHVFWECRVGHPLNQDHTCLKPGTDQKRPADLGGGGGGP